jgi:hypothetical protein
MEIGDKTRLIINLRNIIHVLGITKEELFGIDSDTDGSDDKQQDKQLTFNKEDNLNNDVEDNFGLKSHDLNGFLARHSDSSIKLDDNTIVASTPTNYTDINNNVDPSLVDDSFGGK